ncbi:ROK family transcriptional regulator [Micromonospora sp. KC721]|uniref:ROK family transcriptional regulator n=1 Tax=Micromonospora sp. KC721 TaxID=2530380 RepID=UPI001A9EEA36|nr:ROK family transcriptional regulator [Micromonospora sp. KC721]
MSTAVRSPWPALTEGAREVLLDLLVHGPMPRAEIAARLRMSRPTLSRLTGTLVAAGLLAEGGTELRSRTGRPSELLHVKGGSHHFLGVKLTADRLYAAVTDLTATLVGSAEETLASTEADDVVAQVAAVATGVGDLTGPGGLTGLGVTLGSAVQDGVVLDAGFLDWRGVPLASALTAATGLPAAVDNDVQALTLCEHWFGARAGADSMVLITVGAGVGLGIVSGGRLVQGAHGRPPRFGHLLVDPTGPKCGYGHRGCVSSFLMTEMIMRQLPGRSTYEEAVEQARSGHPESEAVFQAAGYALGVLIGHAANILDPERILLTGEGLPLYEVAEAAVARGLRNTYEDDPALIDLTAVPFDFSEWARSAAALSIRATVTGTR